MTRRWTGRVSNKWLWLLGFRFRLACFFHVHAIRKLKTRRERHAKA